jgi:hypothetical protein
VKKIKAFIAKIKLAIMAFFFPTLSSLLETIRSVEASIERLIDAEIDNLQQLDATRKAVAEGLKKANADVDAAYKLLHNVSRMTN